MRLGVGLREREETVAAKQSKAKDWQYESQSALAAAQPEMETSLLGEEGALRWPAGDAHAGVGSRP